MLGGTNGKVLGTVLWDFAGILVRMVRAWRYAVLDVLDSAIPGHQHSAGEIGIRLRAGYLWHTPERPHPELNSPDEWWRYVESERPVGAASGVAM